MKVSKQLFLKVILIIFLLSIIPIQYGYSQNFQPTPAQQSISQSLAQKLPNLKITWDSKLRMPLRLDGIHSEPLPLDPKAVQSYFVNTFGPLYQIKAPDREIQTGLMKTNPQGITSLPLYQKYENIPVYGVSLNLRLDKDKRLQSILGKWIQPIEVDPVPRLNQKQATESVIEYLRKKYKGPTPLPQEIRLEPDAIRLVIFNPSIYGKLEPMNYLAYHVILKAQVFFVNAHTGEIIYTYSNIQDSRDRKTYSTTNCLGLPGTLKIDENGPVGGATPDAVTQNAHNFAGAVYDYFWNTHGRDSYDNMGATIVQTVHSGIPLSLVEIILCCLLGLDCCDHPCNQINAAWIPAYKQVVYGDGGTLDDGRSFNPFPNALDTVAHELSHAVTQYSIFDDLGKPVGLDYTGESGALNESYSDFFGAMVDRDDWLVGEDLVTAGYPAGALRNMADPTNGGAYDPANPDASVNKGHQPDHMDNYVSGGDVHLNSGIPNKVAYLISEGGTHPRSGITVKGIGRNATEKIYYQMLTEKLNQTATFMIARQASLDATAELYPGDTFKQVTVWNAFVACGICDAAVANDCTPKEYPSNGGWLGVFKKLFGQKSDLALLREYRDKVLVQTPNGGYYTKELYKNSEEALDVLVRNPESILEAKELIEANKDSIREVLKGRKGVITNTDRIISFLDKYAEKSPTSLKMLVSEVKKEMIKSQEQGEPFLGFWLEKEKIR